MNRIRQHLNIGNDIHRFDKEIDNAILSRIRKFTNNPELSWEDMLKTAEVTIETYLDTKHYRKLWIRVGERKVLHVEVDWKKNLLNIQEF